MGQSGQDCGLSLLLAALTMADLSTLLPPSLVDDTVEHPHMGGLHSQQLAPGRSLMKVTKQIHSFQKALSMEVIRIHES